MFTTKNSLGLGGILNNNTTTTNILWGLGNNIHKIFIQIPSNFNQFLKSIISKTYMLTTIYDCIFLFSSMSTIRITTYLQNRDIATPQNTSKFSKSIISNTHLNTNHFLFHILVQREEYSYNTYAPFNQSTKNSNHNTKQKFYELVKKFTFSSTPKNHFYLPQPQIETQDQTQV